MRCLISGGAGFIGSHLVDRALRQGFEVRVLDDLSTGSRENLTHCLGEIELVVGDVRDRDLVHRAAQGAEVVFHHAALTAVPLTVEDPFRSAEVNDLGTLNVFLAASRAGARRVVYASSSAVYGSIDSLPHHEDMTPQPNSPYAAHKLLGEYYGKMFGDLYGLEVVSLRYFNVFGPRQDPGSPYSGVMSIFMDRLNKGLRPVIFGDGGQSRDFIYIKDVVEANYLAAAAEGAAGQAFNIGTGRAVTLHRILEALADLTGRQADPAYEPPRPGDVYESRADVTRASEGLCFAARTSFEDGLALTWDWFTKGGRDG